MKFKAMLFDKDGTLLEFHKMWLNVSRGACERVKSYSDQHQGNQTVTPAELLLAIGVEGDVVDNYFESQVADPYRWLEDDLSLETGEWVKSQNEV